MRPPRLTLAVLALVIGQTTWAAGPPANPKPASGAARFQPIPSARFKLGGEVGRRIDVGVDRWLVPAPVSNPGMLDMFRVRDRKPVPQIVPWAGEFAGKYLISAVQTLRMSDDPRLEATVRAFVSRLIAAQDADGYLGPFPRAERLLGNWDLWGHYHVMLGLLAWHERTGDLRALDACKKMAALVLKTYPEAKKSFLDAGSQEMNLAIAHGLGRLHLVSPDPRLLPAMKAVEKDWERAGDYLRTGLAGVDYFRTPRPRWESFHDLQALVSLFEITGDAKYATAFLNHWWSIRRTDRHNTGGFSTGEQACGDAYEPGAIETCCTIAWSAITLDALRLTGDPTCADELELSLENAILGAQHPSGRWCTYSTPMDGIREASPHAIVFQARAGTPELNCCSVNGPRGLGMLSEWAVMRKYDGTIVVNYLGPMKASLTLADGTPLTLETRTKYPLDGTIELAVNVAKPATFALQVRVPGFVDTLKVDVPGRSFEAANRARFLRTRREWRAGDVVRLRFDLPLRAVPGDRATAGMASIYRGPILLAFDPRFNAFDADALPTLRPADLAAAKVTFPPRDAAAEAAGAFAPQLLVEVPTSDGRVLRLCDYATAGASGTPYRSWLPMRDLPPAPPLPVSPDVGATLPWGPFAVAWRPSPLAAGTTYRLVVSGSPDLSSPLFTVEQKGGSRLVVPEDKVALLKPESKVYWTLTARNAHGTTASDGPSRLLRIGQRGARPNADAAVLGAGPDALLVADRLAGAPRPEYGALEPPTGIRPAEGPDGKAGGAVETDGVHGKLIYGVPGFPEWEYAVSLRVRVGAIPDHLGQLVSAWTAPQDDPIRVVIEKGKLYARIEAGGGVSTDPGVPVPVGKWIHVAAVKRGSRLTLYLDGKPVASAPAPVGVRSASRAVALGGNPRFPGDEHLNARFADLRLFARALDDAEVSRLAGGP